MPIMYLAFKLSVVRLIINMTSAVMISVLMLSAVILSVTMINVITLSVFNTMFTLC